jgi:hypothetical protein
VAIRQAVLLTSVAMLYFPVVGVGSVGVEVGAAVVVTVVVGATVVVMSAEHMVSVGKTWNLLSSENQPGWDQLHFRK